MEPTEVSVRWLGDAWDVEESKTAGGREETDFHLKTVNLFLFFCCSSQALPPPALRQQRSLGASGQSRQLKFAPAVVGLRRSMRQGDMRAACVT